MNWQYLNILAATNYLRERMASGVPDARAKDVYEGLLDVLHPSRIEARLKGPAAPAEPPPAAPPAAPARRRRARATAPVKAKAKAKRPKR